VLTALLQAPLGSAGGVVGDVLALGIIVVATNAWVLGASRLVVAASRRRLLPSSLSRGGPRTLGALTGCYAVLLAGVGLLGVDEATVAAVVSCGFLLLYVLVALCALRARPVPGLGSLRLEGWLTLAISLVFLAFAGWLLAAALVLALACLVASGVLNPVSHPVRSNA
jgi:amino acid efflux transporter